MSICPNIKYLQIEAHQKMSQEMDVEHATGGSKECFTLCDIKPHSSLRLVRNDCGTTVLWSPHELFAYQNPTFRAPITLHPDFTVHQVLLSNNCAVCIDSNGVAHTVPLKFKINKEKIMKIPFKPRAQGILFSAHVTEDLAASLIREDDSLLLCIHKINSEFKLLKKYTIISDELSFEDHCRWLLKTSVGVVDKAMTQKVFNVERNDENTVLILFSFDRLTVFGQIIHLKEAESQLTPTKLFTCPTEISDVEFMCGKGLKILLGLKSGTVVALSCEKESLEAKIIHLNTAIEKILPVQEHLIYTDGVKMWMVENTLSEKDLIFRRIFVTQPYDFIKYDDRIICITYNKLIYTFCTAAEDIFVEQSHASDGYLPVPRDLTSSKKIVMDIMEEVKKNEQILKKIKLENNLTTALALSTKNTLLDRHIYFNAYIFDKYEDLLNDHSSFFLTSDFKEYFDPKSLLLLVKMQVSSEFRPKFNEICLCLSSNIQLHITIFLESFSQTVTVPLLNKPLDNLCCVLPIKVQKSPLQITIKIISPIAGPLDPTHMFWTILVSRDVQLNSEHFIKADQYVFNDKIISYRRTDIELEKMVTEFARINHGSAFEFEAPQQKIPTKECTCYLKLPKNYRQIFGDKKLYAKTLNTKVSEYLAKKLGANEFLKMHSTVHLSAADTEVSLQIKEGEDTVLKICGANVVVVFDLRTYFSKLVYESASEEGLVQQAEYTRIENLRRQLRELLAEGNPEETAVLNIAEQFHKYTLGTLPL